MYILTISYKANLPSSFIDDLIKRHRTPQDSVIVKYTDDELPNGFVITRSDSLATQVEEVFPEVAKEREFANIVFREKRLMIENAKYSGDQLLKDENIKDRDIEDEDRKDTGIKRTRD